MDVGRKYCQSICYIQLSKTMCVFTSEGEIYYLALRQRVCGRYQCSNLSSKFFFNLNIILFVLD